MPSSLLRIGTWNVERAALPKNERRLALLRAAEADVWVLTETRDALDLSPTHQPVHSQLRARTRVGERWVSIWSRLPVLDVVPVADAERTAAALLATPLGALLVYGTVLPWQHDLGPTGEATAWSEQYRVLPLQGAEWSALRERLPHAAVCVAGDFNLSLGGPRYYGTRRGVELLDAALRAADLAVVTRTEMVPDGLLAYPPIDHVALSTSLARRARVVSAWQGTVDGVRLSDHSALVVEVGS